MKYIYSLLFIFIINKTFAQIDTNSTLYAPNTTLANRTIEAIELNKIIKTNLSLPISKKWIEAFDAITYTQYKEPWIYKKLSLAFKSNFINDYDFAYSLLAVICSQNATQFATPIKSLMNTTINSKIFVIVSTFLAKNNLVSKKIIVQKINEKLKIENNNTLLIALKDEVENTYKQVPVNILQSLLDSNFLKGHTILFSFQRKNRNYPGIAIVRNSTGKFEKLNDGTLFYVPQLARSVGNLSCFITNGNTPQGIFKMNDLQVSKLIDIGPTNNIQLMMPYETSIKYFLQDSSNIDTAWSLAAYKNLLPQSAKNYNPLYQTFYASKIGRSEIIAHGSTVNTNFYKGLPFYPHTPTLGCLCTSETWNETTGKRELSNQQALVNAVLNTGDKYGYCIVLELDNQQKPININEIQKILNKP